MGTIRLALVSGLFTALAAGPVAAAPGELSPVEIDTVGNVFGYWEYLPAAYDEAEQWPLFIFLSGIGENGVGTLDPTECGNGPDTAGDFLCRNLRHGPQNLLWRQLYEGEAGLWDDVERPFVVISPQNPAPLFTYTAYDVDDLDDFLQFLIDNYAIDPRRMYLVGMSMGGYSTVLSVIDYPHRYAAISTMPGIAGMTEWAEVCNLTEQNMWIFHGEADTNPFPPSGMVSFGYLFSQCPEPVPTPRITVYEGLGHNVWTQTIQPELGLNTAVLDSFFAQGANVDLDPYDVDLYTWLLEHDKPVVDAADVEGTTDDALVQLTATTIDDDAIDYTWTQTGGGAVTLANENTDTLDVSGFAVGVYTFEVLAVDADDQHDVDDVTLTIVEGVGGSTSTGGGETTGGVVSATTGEMMTTSGLLESSGGVTESGVMESGGVDSSGAATMAEGPGTSDPSDPSDPTADPSESESDSNGTTDGTDTTAPGSASATASGTATTNGGTGAGGDSDTDTDGPLQVGEDPVGCNCTSSPAKTGNPILLLLLLAGVRRRRSVR